MSIDTPISGQSKQQQEYNANATRKLKKAIISFRKKLIESDKGSVDNILNEMDQVFKGLLAKGADPSVETNDCRSVLHTYIVALHKMNNHQNIPQLKDRLLRTINDLNLDVNQRAGNSTVFNLFIGTLQTTKPEAWFIDVLYDYETFDLNIERGLPKKEAKRASVNTDNASSLQSGETSETPKTPNTPKMALPAFLGQVAFNDYRNFNKNFMIYLNHHVAKEVQLAINANENLKHVDYLNPEGVNQVKREIFRQIRDKIDVEKRSDDYNAISELTHNRDMSLQEFIQALKNINEGKDYYSNEELEEAVKEGTKKKIQSIEHPDSIRRYYDIEKISQEIELKSFKRLQIYKKQFENIQDYLEIKMYGHKFGLAGCVQYENEQYRDVVSLEGFNVSHTYPSVLASLDTLQSSSEMQTYLESLAEEKRDMTKKAIAVAKNCFKDACGTLAKDASSVSSWSTQAKNYRDGKPIIFESKWTRHSATTILYKDRIYICNKGAGTSVPGIKCYKIGNIKALLGDPPNLNSIQEKLLQLSTTERKDSRLVKEFSGILPGIKFSNHEMMKDLELTREAVIEVKGQVVGNCTYTNSKRGIDGLLIALEDRERLDNSDVSWPNDFPEEWRKSQQETLDVNISHVDRKSVYHLFGLHDRLKEVEKYCDKLESLGKDKLETSHKGYTDVIFLTLKMQNDALSERNVTVGKYILDRLVKLGYTHEEIYQHIQALEQDYSLAAVGYTHYAESQIQDFDQNKVKRAGREILLVTTKGGKDLKQREFLEKIGLKGFKLTPDEKQILSDIDRNATDKSLLKRRYIKGAFMVLSEFFAKKISNIASKIQASAPIIGKMISRFKGLKKAANHDIEDPQITAPTVPHRKLSEKFKQKVIDIVSKVRDKLSNIKIPRFKTKTKEVVFISLPDDYFPDGNDPVAAFNQKPNNGIKALLGLTELPRDMSPHQEAIANFIFENRASMNLKQIGDYLSTGGNEGILQAYINKIPIDTPENNNATQYVQNLKTCLESDFIGMPGESQKIDRIMKALSTRIAGPDMDDTQAYVLAFAIIMLNTDLHNPNVESRMTQEQFINNINVNMLKENPIDESFLKDIYDTIRDNPLVMPKQEPTQQEQLCLRILEAHQSGKRVTYDQAVHDELGKLDKEGKLPPAIKFEIYEQKDRVQNRPPVANQPNQTMDDAVHKAEAPKQQKPSTKKRITHMLGNKRRKDGLLKPAKENQQKAYTQSVYVTGDSGTDKNNLVRRYCDDRYEENHIVLRGNKKREVELDANASLSVTMRAPTGTERYKVAAATTNIQRAETVVICFDLTDRSTFDNVKEWIREVQKYQDEANIIIVGTKMDEADNDGKRKVTAAEAKEFADSIGRDYLECSTRTGLACPDGIKDNTITLREALDDTFKKFEKQKPGYEVSQDMGKKIGRKL